MEISIEVVLLQTLATRIPQQTELHLRVAIQTTDVENLAVARQRTDTQMDLAHNMVYVANTLLMLVGVEATTISLKSVLLVILPNRVAMATAIPVVDMKIKALLLEVQEMMSRSVVDDAGRFLRRPRVVIHRGVAEHTL